MAELNDAYAQLRTPDRRAVYDRLRQPVQASNRHERAAAPTRPAGAPAESPKKDVLDFGRYVGWSLAKLAAHDPDYLRWLSRHSSGIRYRREIGELLDASARSKDVPKTKRR